MSLHLPPERDVPNPDAMFQRIVAEPFQAPVDARSQRHLSRVWLLPAAAAVLVMVVGIGYLLREVGPATDAGPPPAAAPSATSPVDVASTVIPVMTVSPSFVGEGTAVLGDLELSVTKDADDGESITAAVRACAKGDERIFLTGDQWSLAGSTLSPLGIGTVDVGPGECVDFTVMFSSPVRPAVFRFTDADGRVASWTLS